MGHPAGFVAGVVCFRRVTPPRPRLLGTNRVEKEIPTGSTSKRTSNGKASKCGFTSASHHDEASDGWGTLGYRGWWELGAHRAMSSVVARRWAAGIEGMAGTEELGGAGELHLGAGGVPDDVLGAAFGDGGERAGGVAGVPWRRPRRRRCRCRRRR